MRFTVICTIVLIVSVHAFEPHFMKDPAVSPDGKTVCFSYANDLWTVPFSGGEAKRMTSVAGDDSNPDYSPDGRYIAFNSDRDGSFGVYTMPTEGGIAKKVVTGDYSIADWFADSENLLLTKNVSYTGSKMYKININGSGLTDLNRMGFFYSDLSKENDKMVFAQNGEPYRERMTGSQNGRLFICDMAGNSYIKIADSPLTERYPVYSKTGRGIYFARSDGKLFQIYLLPLPEIGKPDPKIEKITDFEKWSARDISIAYTNDRMAYEYFDEIWTTDPASGVSGKLKIDINEDILGTDIVNDNNITTVDKFYPSVKGNWALFKSRFDLFAVPVEGGEIKKITRNNPGIDDFIIMNDNETVYFTAYVKGQPKLFKSSVRSDKDPEPIAWSSDKFIERLQISKGKLFVFYESGDIRGRIALKDEKTEDFKEINIGRYAETAEVSNDGNYIFITVTEEGLWNKDIFIYDIRSGQKELIYSSNDWIGNKMIDPDEDFMFYNKGEALYRADLKNLTEFYFEKDKWKEILEKKESNDKKKDASKTEKKSEFPKINLKDTEKMLISRPGISYVIGFAKDKNFYYMNEFEEKNYLRKADYQMKNDELVAEFPGGRIGEVFLCDSASTVFYYQSGRIKAFDLNSKKIKDTPVDIKYSYSKKDIYRKVFDEVHSVFERWFYDPAMHGTDWKKLGELYSEYLKYDLEAESFASVIEEMIGEVNASHTGYYPKNEREVKYIPVARTGLEFDITSRLSKGLKVSKVYQNSILKTVHGIEAGDILLSVDGIEITTETDADRLFLNKVDDKISLVFSKKDGKKKTALIKGLENDYDLRYQNWVSERKAIVEKLSGGQIGYVHIEGMSEVPLQKFIDDLFTENFNKKALIIDVRYNGGGYTHDELIEILTKKHYALTTTRIGGAKKLKSPFNIWDKPSTLLINRNSFSDAEIFPNLYREFKLGKIIGTPTSGGVIGTSPRTLIDGSSMRLPRIGWFTKDGINMEGTGVEPDIVVDPTFNQLLDGDDPELKKAIELMLGEIK